MSPIKKGRIEAVVGCMSSGKSEVLISRITRAKIAKRKTIVFKPTVDTRTGAKIKSRSGAQLDAVPVERAADILERVLPEHSVIGIDEAQFFDEGIVQVVETLVDLGKRVIVAGLDVDAGGRPFGFVPQLLAIADDVIKAKAVCMQCGETAVRSQMLVPPPADAAHKVGDSDIVVGGDDAYEARCRDCHHV